MHFFLATTILIGSIVGTCDPGIAREARLLTNARIYTVNADHPWVDAIAIDADGIIAAAGSATDVRAALPDALEIDLGGRMVLPGFQDVHLHAVEAGITATFCQMPQFGSRAELSEILTECRQSWAGGDWIMGAGVNMFGLLETVDDPLALIDATIPDRPAIVIDDLGHGAWANSRAMAEAGLARMSTDPAGGALVRQANGRLSGVVLESLSQTLIDAAQRPTPSNTDFAYESLAGAMATLAQNGITSVSDAGGYWPRGHENVWRKAEAEKTLTVRASNALYVYPDRGIESQIEDLKQRFTNDPDALVRFNQVKIYVDGILTQATAALLQPYEAGLELEADEQLGFEYFPRDVLFRYARELSAAGFQLHFHATGDRGTRLALDAIAQADPRSGPHRITHLYMVDPEDIPRFAELDVVADLQMAPSSLDVAYAEFLKTFIGQRAAGILPLQALLENGAAVTLSSDWDADELSPLVKLTTVLTQSDGDAPDLASALEMMTINPARLLKHADRTGTIEPGKFADLVVLDQNLFNLDPEDIQEATINATLFQGDAIYDPLGIFAP